jgi:translocation and assembly module TamA
MYLFLLLSGFCLCQFTYAALFINGVPTDIKHNIEKRIDYKLRSTTEIDERFLDQIRRETEEAIKPFGYFSPQILVSSDKKQDIYVDINLRKLAHIRSIHIEYTHTPDNQDFEALIYQISQLYVYSPFNTKILEDISNKIKMSAIPLGYNDIVITRSYTSINRQTHLADVTYLITPNEKNLFGEIIYPNPSDAKCLNRFTNIQDGDHYNPKQLNIFQKNMMKSGLYTSSNIRTAPRKGAPFIQDIFVEYTPAKPIQFFLGFGLNANISESTINPQAQADVDFNNLGGCGNNLSIGIRGSTSGGQLRVHTLVPKADNINHFSLFSAKMNTQHYNVNNSSDYFKVTKLTQYYMYPFTHQLSINYLIEKTTLNKTTNYSTVLLFPKYRIMTKFNGEQSNFSFKAKAIAGAQSVFSDFNFFQVDFTTQVRANLKKLHFSHQLSYGKTFTNDFNNHPISLHYYLGGADSNRGLSYREIQEGKSFLLSRNQAQYRIKHHILIGGFIDAGFCTKPNRVDTNYPAYGLLASYVTGFGQFECSVGRLVNDDKWVILLNIAPGTDAL